MNRYYTDYVRHALRFYTRNMEQTLFESPADSKNWFACAKVINNLSALNRDILVSIYRSRDTLADSVYEASVQFNIDQSIIWDLMKIVERDIAIIRGLL